MINWEDDKGFQKAIREYLSKNGLALSGDETYQSGIDCVGVFVDDRLVLSVGLPPVSNYPVRETEYTQRYLRAREKVAV